MSEQNLRFALAQMFTETRWKTGYLEVRSVDGLGPKYRIAAAAFWTGILYDRATSEWVSQELGTKLNKDQRQQLWLAACRDGLQAKSEGVDLVSITEQLFERARACLVKRGLGEEKFLEPLVPLIEKRSCPAREILDFWKNEARGDIAMLLNYLSPTR